LLIVSAGENSFKMGHGKVSPFNPPPGASQRVILAEEGIRPREKDWKETAMQSMTSGGSGIFRNNFGYEKG
jgi:hypothetical protein